jgi:4-amino-4-deoxychorismate lyase
MCRLVESIKVENRRLLHLEWHNKRFNEARREAFGIIEPVKLQNIIEIPSTLSHEVYKCRILYGKEIEEIEFQPYTVRPVKTLKIVNGGNIDYHLKYENREALVELMKKRGKADDILIVKNGFITDTSYSNIAFFNGHEWFTPDTYLLNGTQRQRLLSEGIIRERTIKLEDLTQFICAKSINAMLEFKKTDTLEIII